ncbi:MAG: hypothetical protein KJ949_00935 [Nanoarchaeota archaeon]|nr:hypothetical protein [Nanoarchaeota archaeon]
MRKIIIPILLALICISFIAAETTIIFNEQPNEVYNLGETINLPVTIKTTSDIYGLFELNLLCGGSEISFYKNGVSLTTGEEKRMETSLVLMKDLILTSKGKCKIKAILGENYQLTEEFKISDSLTIELSSEQTEFQPGEKAIFEGYATKENGKQVNGFIELSLVQNNSDEKIYLETINNGYFLIALDLGKNTKAGPYLVSFRAYEQNPLGEKTNTGFLNKNIDVRQVPTSLEIILETPEVEPGTNAQIKAILHDQTGEKIPDTTAILTIKNSNDKIREQVTIATDELFEFPIKYNEPVSEFKIHGISNKLEADVKFKILEKEDISVELINRTITISNKGNVEYCNKTVLVKIGNESLNIDVCLGVDKEQKYFLTAPDGEYQVEVISDGGTEINEKISLTGKVIDIREARSKVGNIKYYFAWIFIIVILGFVTFIVFKKGYNKKVLAYLPSFKKKKKDDDVLVPLKEKSLVKSKNKAELSLSIKGDKQNVSVIGLKIKNLNKIQSQKTNAEETLQKIVETVEESKAATYENQSDIFFILAPTKTRTFKNESVALKIAEKIKLILDEYNKLAKQKIEFGISLNYGTMIIKPEKSALKFMSLGTLMTVAKKLASLSNSEILLGEPMNTKLGREVKSEKKSENNIEFYELQEVKHTEDHKKFLKSFLERLEK